MNIVDTPLKSPFYTVNINFSPLGGTVVEWELDSSFIDDLPYSFQLQYGEADSDGEDVWEDVGDPVEDTFVLVDEDQRVYGSTLEGAYRVLLTTSKATYSSGPVTAETGAASYSAWRIGQEIVRAELLRMNLYFNDQEHRILRAKRSGPPCRRCIDPFSDTPKDPRCTRCYGTSFDGGYFSPVRVPVLIEHGEPTETTHGAAPASTARSDVAVARFAGYPRPMDRDIIIEYGTGRRWMVHEAAGRAEIGSYVVCISRQIKLLPFSDIAYLIGAEE